ncbi:alpha-L-fucosidase [Catalinimonas alkaloidigena]|uniref:alpha-L-fucosidase n=1 Tax=Catalinimonas alkaloidigena TaxID=1075417 RepID=UPI0024058F8D|nr:alpha-L-fucosidase [Catalinimonas alkaloidigena]MDF9798668.1 alpha-L-fucosidase [Catalinimonas alkaloidigena]
MKRIASFLFFCLFSSSLWAQAPAPYGPVPSERQLAWQDLEYYAFVHFNMNTFSDMEWGYGNESPKLFNPTQLDCRQWARIAKKAGMKGIILTAKHHDGFCLWPSEYTEHSVKSSPWKNGQGDVLQELREACDEYGLEMGVYLSPWDRNHPDYGKPEYLTYFRNQLRELLTQYGDIFEVWFDGANGGDGYYGGANEERKIDRKTYYDWENTYKIVRDLQPMAVLFSDAGPDVRWVGTEEGFANKTNWSLLRRDEAWPGWPRYLELRSGHEDGTHWLPAEVNTSTRPGWYYHESEDHKVKTLPELLNIYYHSIGRNGTFLLNFPVDTRGLIHEEDSARVIQLAEQIKKDFANNLAVNNKVEASQVRNGEVTYAADKVNDNDPETYWATDDGVTSASLTIDLGEPTFINRFLVQEYIPLGQRVKSFTLEGLQNGSWKTIAEEATIGYKRILRFPDIEVSKVRFTVTEAKACPLISNLELYRAPKVLSEPRILRNKEGVVEIISPDLDARVYYTTNGQEPTAASKPYTKAFNFAKKGTIKAIIIDAQTGKSSPVASVDFDISRADWKLLQPKGKAKEVNAIWDGKASTQWGVEDVDFPAEWIVDLGKSYRLKGLTYLPDQSRYAAGIVSNYEVYVSEDGKNWGTVVAEGEFSNIRNNPIAQQINFNPKSGRFVKFVATKITDGQDGVKAAELGVITE